MISGLRHLLKSANPELPFRNALTFALVWILFLSAFPVSAQIVINEASSANLYTLFDEDHDAEDWIELYNRSTDTISVHGWYLSDKKSVADMWKIPDVKIYPDSFALFFASGKNRNNVVHHWETAVYCDSIWRYLNPGYEPPADWEWPSFSDTSWAQGYGGFGFGDDDDTTVTYDTLRTIYLRKSFDISDTSKIINAVLHADYDDGFVMYLNGHEIIRENIQPDGKTPHYLQPAMWVKEAQMYQGGLPQSFVINKPLLRRYLKNGENVLAIQCHNRWDDSDMTIKPWLSFGISDTTRMFGPVPEWFFPSDPPLHTNFGISPEGEKIYLFNPFGVLVSEMDVPPLQTDISYGLLKDGSDSLVWFNNPTPGFSNDSISGLSGAIEIIPQITPYTGSYNDSVLVAMNSADTLTAIRFTLDGSAPKATSELYTAPFYIDSTVVIRARLFRDGYVPSKVVTETLFFNESTAMRMISIATDPDYLWNEDFGIYVLGTQYLPDRPNFGANFWDDTEIPVHINLFDADNASYYATDCGLKIHGGWTRSIAQKSIRPMAKGKYGSEYFYNRIFNGKPINKYKRFVLRNGGNDHYSCFFRDALIHKLVENDTYADILDYDPVLVFINGDYWGIHNMREKIDRYYLESNYHIDPEKVDILEEQGEVISGENADFLNLMDFVKFNDLSLDENYQIVQSQVDLESFTDVIALNTFFVNTDWPHNNMKWWRHQGGKWNYFLMDLDMSSGISNNNKPYVEQLQRMFNDTVTANMILFQRLLKNQEYRNYFINRYADLMNSALVNDKMIDLTDSIVDILRPEMQRHKERWGSQSASTWEYYYVEDVFKGFLNLRHQFAREHVEEAFELENQVDLHFSSFPPESGRVKINTIIPELPFEGIYFNPVPIKIESLPAPGCEFSYWKNSDSTWISYDRITEHTFQDDDTLIAVFSGVPDTAGILITEIMHSPHKQVDCGDWIELYNAEESQVDISGWRISVNGNIYGPMPQSTVISSGSFLVLAADTASFFKVYHDSIPVLSVHNLSIYDTKSEIVLLDSYHNRISAVNYDVLSPWPRETVYTGRSAELSDVALNPEFPENWITGCLGGSPGSEWVECTDFPDIIFTEFNVNSFDGHDAGDWVEIYNRGDITADLTGWIFHDRNDDNIFRFPKNAVLNPGEYKVIARDPVMFDLIYPEMSVFSPFDFGLGDDDSLVLLNRYQNEICGIGYHKDSLWPDDIYGSGRTAELISTDSVASDPASWKNGCYGGTPGMPQSFCNDNPELLITEIQYHPHDEYNGGTYFELFNNDTSAVNLHLWKILNRDSTVNMTMEEPYNLEAGEYLVFPQNPPMFSSVFPDAPYYEYSTGITFPALADSFGLQDKFGVTRIWMRYDVSAPWPEIQDSTGKAMELFDYEVSFTNPENWFAGCKEGSPGHEFKACDTTSITEFENYFSVIPNPFDNFLIIRSENGISITDVRILNGSGQVVTIPVRKNSPESWYLNTATVSSGVYLLEIRSKSSLFYRKILKFE